MDIPEIVPVILWKFILFKQKNNNTVFIHMSLLLSSLVLSLCFQHLQYPVRNSNIPSSLLRELSTSFTFLDEAHVKHLSGLMFARACRRQRTSTTKAKPAELCQILVCCQVLLLCHVLSCPHGREQVGFAARSCNCCPCKTFY